MFLLCDALVCAMRCKNEINHNSKKVFPFFRFEVFIFCKNFYLVRKYVHRSSPHKKFWRKSLTTFDYLSKAITKNFFTLWLYFYRVIDKIFGVRNAFVRYLELISFRFGVIWRCIYIFFWFFFSKFVLSREEAFKKYVRMQKIIS